MIFVIYIDSSLKNVILINTRENTLLSNDNQQQIENPLKFGFNVSKSQLQSEKKNEEKGKTCGARKARFYQNATSLHASCSINIQCSARKEKSEEERK